MLTIEGRFQDIQTTPLILQDDCIIQSKNAL